MIIILCCIIHVKAKTYINVEPGLNKTIINNIIDQTPIILSPYIKFIRFHDHSHIRWNGYAKVRWYSDHVCYNGQIDIYVSKYTRLTQYQQMNKTFIHELGHIHDFCINKQNISTEEYANEYTIN